MKNKQNLHIHTTYVDGKHSPEELIQEAICRNFDSVGFSEHTYLEYASISRQLTPEKMVDYKKEILYLKDKYKGKIDIYCGLEFDFYSDVDVSDFDYLIGSVHYLDFGNKIDAFEGKTIDAVQNCIRTYFNGDTMAFAKKYFETVARLPEKHNFDILGHFDVITKFNEKGHFIDTTSKEYINMGLEAIHCLRGKIPLFEVNTGAIGRGHRTAPYPQIEFLKEFYRCGYGVIISSDCHDKSVIDCYFDQANQLIQQVGFKSKWIFTDNGFVEVPL